MKDMKALMSLMGDKKEDTDMSEQDIQAKMDVLQELLAFASKHAGDDLVGRLKQVTVAAPSEKGLEEGLMTAKDMVKEMPESDDDDSEEDSDEEDFI